MSGFSSSGSLFICSQMKIAFLYTLHANLALFAPYIDRYLSRNGVDVSHFLDESLLTQALTDPDASSLEQNVRARLNSIEKTGVDIIVCTCSSIADYAENSPLNSVNILRIDRAMAESAIQFRHVHIVAAAGTSVFPTYKLLLQCKHQHPTSAVKTVDASIVPNAWEHYVKGEHTAFISSIRNHIENLIPQLPPNSVIVLSQASMSSAATQLHLSTPVLSSPAIGIPALLTYQ